MIGYPSTEFGEARMLDHERREVEAAIELVATGHIVGVVIANLAHCRRVVDELRGRAEERGVDLALLAHGADQGCDVSVRRH